MKRIRAVKFVVHPVLVVDEGDELTSIDVEPIEVEPRDWPTFSAETWPQMVAAREESLNDFEGGDHDA